MGNIWDKIEKKEDREIDVLAGDIHSWYKKAFVFMVKTKIRTWKGVFILAFLAGLVSALTWIISFNLQELTRADSQLADILMKKMKSRGCVADGILSGYGDDIGGAVETINRSQCEYLHRSLETWAGAPDFEKARDVMEKIEKKDMIYGMFIAEALNPQTQYYFPDERRNFNFSAMCKPGSGGFWGERTCKADFSSSEYRKYLRHITQKAIDLGIQSFLFGQIYFQEKSDIRKGIAPEIVAEMRKYAGEKGKTIIIGAQTNNITDEKYLRTFDYIEGGVGIKSNGTIEEENACFSKWWKKPGDRCWALLWHKDYAEKANNVITHLDWSGFRDDDMSIFAQMKKEDREESLRYLYNFFKEKNIGFMMPYLAVINEEIPACRGPRRNFYSPGNKYGCRDEEAITAIFEDAERNSAKFVKQSVFKPMMFPGEKQRVNVTLRNNGESTWTKEKGFKLGSQNPQDNYYFGQRVELSEDEKIEPGQIKEFSFEIIAPAISGDYHFQWQMVRENHEWFGVKTEDVLVTVAEILEQSEPKTTAQNP